MKFDKNNNKIRSVLILILGLIIAFMIMNGDHLFKFSTSDPKQDVRYESQTTKQILKPTSKDSIPDYVRTTCNYILQHGDAPPGYYGGRIFQNREKRLPLREGNGMAIHYREWDVHPRQDGVDRGAERIVTGSDGAVWFTEDHYNTFILIKRMKNGK